MDLLEPRSTAAAPAAAAAAATAATAAAAPVVPFVDHVISPTPVTLTFVTSRPRGKVTVAKGSQTRKRRRRRRKRRKNQTTSNAPNVVPYSHNEVTEIGFFWGGGVCWAAAARKEKKKNRKEKSSSEFRSSVIDFRFGFWAPCVFSFRASFHFCFGYLQQVQLVARTEFYRVILSLSLSLSFCLSVCLSLCLSFCPTPLPVL